MSKVGRNAPCPCGSGRKYKHCCISYRETTGFLDLTAEPYEPSYHP